MADHNGGGAKYNTSHFDDQTFAALSYNNTIYAPLDVSPATSQSIGSFSMSALSATGFVVSGGSSVMGVAADPAVATAFSHTSVAVDFYVEVPTPFIISGTVINNNVGGTYEPPLSIRFFGGSVGNLSFSGPFSESGVLQPTSGGFPVQYGFRANPGASIAGVGTLSQDQSFSFKLKTAGIPGDANIDDVVDLTDFTILAANFNGTSKTWFQGNFNFDGKVDLTDFTILAANFNKSYSPAPASVVPEPAGLSLVLLSFAFHRRRRTGHRRPRTVAVTSAPGVAQTSV